MDLLTGLILAGVCKNRSPCFEKFTQKDHCINEICAQQTDAIRLTPVLAHHDERCLKRCDEEENQVEQDERIRVKGFRSYDLKLSLRFY